VWLVSCGALLRLRHALFNHSAACPPRLLRGAHVLRRAHPAPLLLDAIHATWQVGFGEDARLVLDERRTSRLVTSFVGIGQHVAYFMDNVPL
jgi:hypothetical protein